MDQPEPDRHGGRERGRGARRRKRWILPIVLALLAVVGCASWAVLDHFGAFSGKGDPVTFAGGGTDAVGSKERIGHSDGKGMMPTGPQSEFKLSKTLPSGSGKISVTELQGAKSGFAGKVWVWTPPQYDEPANAHKGFPVMIALPGGDGYRDNYWGSWPEFHGLEEKMAKWSKDGTSLPFILVMPVLNPEKDKYWDGSDIPGQPKMGTWLTQDVPDLARANFRTINSRDGWSHMGASSGGFAAMKAVLKEPSRFKAAITGGPDTVPDAPYWEGHKKEKDENSPPLLAESLIASKKPDVYLAFEVGTKEPKTRIDDIRHFAERYNRGPVKTKFQVNQGGNHDGKAYAAGMGDLLKWISGHMQGPTTAP